MPMLVYTVGCMLGTEKPKWATAGNMAVVMVGVGIASYGERTSAAAAAMPSVPDCSSTQSFVC